MKTSPAKLAIASSEDLQTLQGRCPAALGLPATTSVTLVHKPDGYALRGVKGLYRGTHNGQPCTYRIRHVGKRFQLEAVVSAPAPVEAVAA